MPGLQGIYRTNQANMAMNTILGIPLSGCHEQLLWDSKALIGDWSNRKTTYLCNWEPSVYVFLSLVDGQHRLSNHAAAFPRQTKHMHLASNPTPQ
jgi:hypothetical protein